MYYPVDFYRKTVMRSSKESTIEKKSSSPIN